MWAAHKTISTNLSAALQKIWDSKPTTVAYQGIFFSENQNN